LTNLLRNLNLEKRLVVVIELGVKVDRVEERREIHADDVEAAGEEGG
jgi:hypothetical protein